MTQNCWEFWNCPKEVRDQCEAYTSNCGRECWMVVGHIVTKFKKCPKLSNVYKNCTECPWYKKLKEKIDGIK